jgi:hypothetical protein
MGVRNAAIVSKDQHREKIDELTAIHGRYDYSLVNFDFRVKEKSRSYVKVTVFFIKPSQNTRVGRAALSVQLLGGQNQNT